MAWVLTSNNFDVWLAYDLTDISLTDFSDSSNYALITYVDTQDTTYDEPCIHDNVAGEFEAISGASEKYTPHDCDWLIIEDSEDGWNKKVLSIGNLPGGGDTMPADPGADRILIWDDSASNWVWATPNTGLAISGTNVNVDVTDTNFFLDEDTMVSDSATKVASQQSIKAYVDGSVASAGGYVKIDVSSLGSTTGYVCTGFSNYNKIHLVIEALEPATDNDDLWLRFSTDGGATWISGTNYYWGVYHAAASTVLTYDSDAAECRLNHPTYGVGNGTNEGYHGSYIFTCLQDSSYITYGSGTHSYHDSSTYMYWGFGGFWVRKTDRINALRICFDAGNIDRGRISVYGLVD